MRLLGRVVAGVERGVWWLTSLLLVSVAFLTAWEVIMRYAFRSPHDWTDQSSVLLVMASAFLASGVVLKEKRHISIDVIYLRLSDRWRRVADAFNYICSAIALSVMTGFAVNWTSIIKATGAASTASLPTPRWIICVILVLGLALCVLFSLWKVTVLLTHRE